MIRQEPLHVPFVQRLNFGSLRKVGGEQVQSGSSLHGFAMREGAKKNRAGQPMPTRPVACN